LQRVGAWTTADLRLSYTFNAEDLPGTHPIEVALNCENLTNRYAPFALNTVANLGYDQENGSLQGRVVTLSADLQF
jgi:outer membrane receptor protein involved in Fe transport